MITLKLALAVVAAAGWQGLPPAPITPDYNWRTSVWTGKQMLVYGRTQVGGKRMNVAAAYDPRSREWRKLSPPQQQTSGFMDIHSVWTGKEMLVWGQGTRLAYNPATDVWRTLPFSHWLSIHDGFGAVLWDGREMLGWGGGCCGDAFSDGVAFNPVTNRWRALPDAHLEGDQHPVGVWTGRRYLVFAGTRTAAYDPVRNRWHRLTPAPMRAAAAVWSGSRAYIATTTRRVLSYDPAKDRWQSLPLLPLGRVGGIVAFDGARLLVWGGSRGGASIVPGEKKWTTFAYGPLPAKLEATAVWTGTSLIVSGKEGAAYTPPAIGCGDAWMAENLRVTDAVKEQLRRAKGATHAPLAGHTYYGRYSGVRYAIATFGALPTVFRTDARDRFRVRAQARGTVCSTVVPIELLRAWSLHPTSRGCFSIPR